MSGRLWPLCNVDALDMVVALHHGMGTRVSDDPRPSVVALDGGDEVLLFASPAI
jgi:hypothetical protein